LINYLLFILKFLIDNYIFLIFLLSFFD